MHSLVIHICFWWSIRSLAPILMPCDLKCTRENAASVLGVSKLKLEAGISFSRLEVSFIPEAPSTLEGYDSGSSDDVAESTFAGSFIAQLDRTHIDQVRGIL